MDYFNQIDRILNQIGIRTVEHVITGSSESLRQWTSLRKSDPNASEKVLSTSDDAEQPLLTKVEEESPTGERLSVNEDITATAAKAAGSEVASVPPAKGAD